MVNKEPTIYKDEAAYLYAEAVQKQHKEQLLGNLVVIRAIEIHRNSQTSQSNQPYNPMRAIELAYM